MRRIIYRKSLISKRVIPVLLVLSLLAFISMPSVVSAITNPAFSDEQKKAFQSGVRFFNTAEDSECSSLGGTVAAGKPGPVYLLGDSIGTQIQSGLAGALGAGWAVKPNVLSGRRLSGTPPSPDGLGAVDLDLAAMVHDPANTGKTPTVVVELGTNSGGFSAATVNQMITKIRATAPSANIYWVDTAVAQRTALVPTLNGVNSIIESQAKLSNFNVISWNKKVFGASADPKNMNANAPDNGYIRHADQFVHLTDTGVRAMLDLITASLTGGGGADDSTASTGSCACSGSVNLVGSQNTEKTYNFLVGKGLSAIQAAGLMGNMQAEAHFEPRLVEYSWRNSRGEISKAGSPTSLDDNVPPDQNGKGQPGYGIVQWTSPGRKQGLRNKVTASNGLLASDLGLQLNYLWEELTTSYRDVYDELKQATTLEAATYVILIKYEHPSNIEGNKPKRLGAASAILTKYGSGTTPSADGSGTISGC